MADYRKMYLNLFNKVTDVIEELQQIQRETEDLYIKGRETGLTALNHGKNQAPKK